MAAHQSEDGPGFNNKMPEKIMMPDKVETRHLDAHVVDGVRVRGEFELVK
jgi:hypothetical protein